MHKSIVKTLAAGIMLSASIIGYGQTAQPSPSPLPGVMRVKLQPSVSKQLGTKMRKAPANGRLVTGVTPLDASLQQIGGVSLRPVFPCPPGREEEYAKFGLDQWYEVVFDESMPSLEARRIMRETPGVLKSSTRVPMKLIGDTTPRMVTNAPSRAAAMPFNDPQLPDQWHYHNDGSLPGSVSGADINLFEAWKTSTGNPEVIVAVIDGGIDCDHEDISANLWTNTGEIPGNGIDDDGNGYVDDVHGYNFCTPDGALAAHRHGTHVAGTIAAVNGNGVGVCGIAGGNGTPDSGVRLMSCQVFDTRSGTGDGDFAAAIVYAADMGATIANCSWGWEQDGYAEEDVLDAIRYFTRSARNARMVGGLCIFAAGNTGETGEFYPQCMPEVVSVSALTSTMDVASYSVYGSWVDICAPGGLLDFTTDEGILSTLPGNNYGYMEGTSMAAPHVTGIAALVLSQYGSASLTNESLRTQLLSSVGDLYSYNPGREGLYGSGYIDAAKAMQWSDGEAPATPQDVSVLAAQDNITIEWTVPESADGTVNHHIIYYSTTPFNADIDLSTISAAVVDTKYLASGDRTSYVLTGLEPLTTYYVAMMAVNRWGNASPLSEVMTATTNRGPHMTLVTPSISLRATGTDMRPSATFTIGNTDEGLLKWSADLRTCRFPSSLYALDRQQSAPYSGHPAIVPFAANASVVATDYVKDEYPRIIAVSRMLHAYIGDSDTSLPNSMAQLFTVDADTYPDGFNLTQVYIEGTHGEDPVIEVYRGQGTISEANRLLSYEPSAFSYYQNTTLPEQVYFAPGETFYIVVHFDMGHGTRYPLGMGLSNGTASATQAFMSNDMGQTWTLLSQVLKGTSYESSAAEACWAIRAISQNPDISGYITLNPSQGQVKAGETATVEAVLDASRLINGSYSAVARFTTNESESNALSLPIGISVADRTPDIVFNRIVNFGDLLVGQSKTITVEVFNRGYGDFSGPYGPLQSSDIASTSEHFQAPTLLSALTARATSRFDVTYKPTCSGSHSGQIVFTDAKGTQLKINVQGVATDPAVISVEPETVEVGTLEVGGEPKSVTFDIINSGKYPLQYVMPKYTTDTITGVSTPDTHKYGYFWLSNLDGATDAAYSPMQPIKGAVDVTREFGDYAYWSKGVDIGFDFPYYGKTYDRLYITSFGAIAFDTYTEGLMWGPLYENHYAVQGTGMISAFGSNQLMMGPASKVECGKVDGNFVINFSDVLAVVYDTDYTPISFHMVLCPNGDVEIYYDNFDPAALFEKCRGLFVALNDPDDADQLVVTSSKVANNPWASPDSWTKEGDRFNSFASGTAIRFVAPRPNMITAISPVIGVLSPGESRKVTATVAANTEMTAGDTHTDLIVLSNDPATPQKIVRFKADITGDLHPAMYIADEALDFGEVFRTSVAQREIMVKNTGKRDLTITAVSLDGKGFAIDFTEPIVVPPAQSRDITVTMLTDAEGDVADALIVTTDAGEKRIALKGKVIGCPVADLSYSSVKETLPYLDTKAIPLTITNSGDADMTYSVSAGAHIKYSPSFGDDCKVAYSYTSSTDSQSEKADWVDIETNGLGEHLGLSYYMEADYVEVQLPFPFRYYDKEYTTVYIYDSGFLTFDYHPMSNMWPEPPESFPGGSIYNNVIAPYWGLHSMDSTPTAGTYHYVTDDQLVVSFMEYGNAMNIGVDFQVILRKDGSFSFNYKAANANAVIFSIFGVAGISNADGTDGINLPARTVAFDATTNFTPVVENRLKAGASAVADLTIAADEMAGSYASAITVATDAPATGTLVIPVDLTVTGSPKPVFSDDIVSEHVKGSRVIDADDYFLSNGALYYEIVSVKNEGSAEFAISSITFDCPTTKGMYGEEPYFTLYTYGKYVDEIELQEGYGWHPYQNEAYTVGKDELRFAIPMMPSSGGGIADIPGDYTCSLTFRLSGVTAMRTKVVDVTFRVTEAPAAVLDKEEIHISNAQDGTTYTEKVTLTNKGAFPLSYEYDLDLSGNGAAISAAAYATSEYSALAPMKSGMRMPPSLNYLDVPGEGEYTNYLYWEAAAPSSAYSYGSTTTYYEFKAATRYYGPEEGFNVSDVFIMFSPYNYGGKNIKAEIVNGDVTTSTDVLGTGYYLVPEGEYTAGQLSLAVISLARPVYISPGQEFNVVITFPEGNAYPVGLVPKLDAVEDGRYMAYAENFGSWFDIAKAFQSQVGSTGYVATCLERTPGSPWAKLLGDSRGGTLAVGESVDIELLLSADSAPKENGNKAVVVITSNDPDHSVINFPVYLDRNAAPAIVVPSHSVVINEGETQIVTLTVADADGDDFALRIDDSHPDNIATISAVRLVDADAGGEIMAKEEGVTYAVYGAKAGVEVDVAIAPDFGDAGTYTFAISAIDTNSHLNDAVVPYTVAHINRAPQPVATDAIEFAVGSVAGPFDMSAFFTDPDGDELSFEWKISRSGYVETYTAGSSLVFNGLKTGTVTLNVTATDPDGLSASNKIVLRVTTGSGIVDIEALPEHCSYAIYTIDGICIAEGDGAEACRHRIDTLTQGIYVLRISADGRTSSSLILANP